MNEVKTIEYQNERVLLTSQIAELYGADKQQISKNFIRNIERYKPEKHFFALTGDKKREFLNYVQIDDGSKNAQIVYLWTKKGALHHAKSLGTDEAWEAYEDLVDNYFIALNKLKKLDSYMIENPVERAERWIEEEKERQALVEENNKKKLLLELQAPKVAVAESFTASEDTVLVRELAKLISKNGISIGQNRLFEVLRGWGLLMKNSTEPKQRYIDLGYFEVDRKMFQRDLKTKFSKTTRVTAKGQEYIINRFYQEQRGGV